MRPPARESYRAIVAQAPHIRHERAPWPRVGRYRVVTRSESARVQLEPLPGRADLDDLG